MADSRSITRRLFMRHGATAGAALSTLAVTAAPGAALAVSGPPMPITPVERVQRLAKELSHAMDEWMADLGHDGVPDLWQAHIWPASVHENPIWFEHMRNRFQPTPQERVEFARQELIAATKALHPDVSDWRVLLPEDDKGSTVGMFFLIGHPERMS